MTQPASSQAHIDGPLTSLSIAYMNDASAFIATKVFPIVSVDKQSNKYFIFDKQAFFRDQAERRGDAQESAGSGYSLSNDTYFCKVWALHKDVGDQVRQNTDSPLNADRNAAEFVTQALLIRREKEFVDTAFVASAWANAVTPSVQWSTYASSDPLNDIETAKTTILSTTGRKANTLVLGYEVFAKLKNHPDLRDMVKYTSSRVITEELLAGLFGVERVLVPSAVIDSNSDAASSASLAFAYGKHALLLHVPPNPGLEIPSAGYTFAWSGLNGQLGGAGLAMSKFRMEHLKADRVEGELAIDVKITGSDLGYFLPSAVA